MSPSVLDAYSGPVRDEYARRIDMWKRLKRAGGPRGVRPEVLRDLRMYGGAQGIWIDKVAATDSVAPDGAGVTVSLMHSGKVVPDNLTDDGLIHLYPDTGRPRGNDITEVSATKNAGFLGLPVFVITVADAVGGALRDVRVGWVEDWNDSMGAFLVVFGRITRPIPCLGDEPGRLFPRRDERGADGPGSGSASEARFRFDAFRPHGYRCAVCDIAAPELLEVVKVAGAGGLVLCASHAKAHRAGLFRLDPATGEVVIRAGRAGAGELGIMRTTRGSRGTDSVS